MRALTFRGLRAVDCETVGDPAIVDPGDAIVEVELAAVCGSDMHVWHGRERGLDAGTVMGHEFLGRVVETGAGVSHVRRGDRVFSPFTTSCGRCFYCTSGLTARCEQGQLFGWVQEGRGLHGGQAELVRVPLADTTLVRLPEGLSPEEGLLLGDVLSTGYFCAKMAGASPAGTYAVVGCGPVGLMAIVGARLLGAERIHALDAVPERLARAQAFGAQPIHAGESDAGEVLRAATAGRGADAVLEAVGSPEATRTAFDLVRPGGTIAAVGVHNETHFPFSPTEAYDRNVTYRIGRCPARAMIDELTPLLLRDRPDVTSIVTHRMPLARGAEAYAAFDARRDGCIKVVLTPR